MTEEIKNRLIGYLIEIATKNGIENVETVSFKKRSVILEKLKAINNEAFDLISTLIYFEIQLDRIEKDSEKKLKKPEVWAIEYNTTISKLDITKNNVDNYLK